MKKAVLETATAHLRTDKALRPIIDGNILPPFRRPNDPFQSLTQSIIYQQLSGKAAGTILKRFLELFPDANFPTPEQVKRLSIEKMRGVGLSGQKTTYIKDLADRFLDGTIEPKKFPKMTDDEIRDHLVIVKGVGRWTADMFLMFTLFRPDILPTGDLAIQKGFQKVFKLKSMPDAKTMEKLSEPWKPYRTVACWYLWRSLDNEQNAGW
jgi:DNA-3-methyladenine glycosylase II